NPCRPVPSGFNLDELFVPGVSLDFAAEAGVFTWRNFFFQLDKVAKLWEKYGSKGIRQKAIRNAEQWMLERTHHSDGLAAIYPPMMYLIMALDVLGYPPDHPDRVEAQRQFDSLMVN